MRKKLLIGLLVLSVALVLSPQGMNLSHAAKKFVSIASGWVVGVYYPLAGAISSIAHKNLPDIKITVESSGASVANAKLIASGDADMAILQNDIAFYALQGVKPMFDKPVANIRGITSLYQEHCQIQARKDAKIATVKDLKGKKRLRRPAGQRHGAECPADPGDVRHEVRGLRQGRTPDGHGVLGLPERRPHRRGVLFRRRRRGRPGRHGHHGGFGHRPRRRHASAMR